MLLWQHCRCYSTCAHVPPHIHHGRITSATTCTCTCSCTLYMYMLLYVVVHAKPYAEAQRKWPPWKYNWRVDVAIPPTLKAERCRKGCTTDVLAARRAHCPNSHPHHPISMDAPRSDGSCAALADPKRLGCGSLVSAAHRVAAAAEDVHVGRHLDLGCLLGRLRWRCELGLSDARAHCCSRRAAT